MDTIELNSQAREFSVKLWPPRQNTRRMLVERMATNLSTPTIYTKNYHCLTSEEATENAKRIEDIAFSTANQQYEKEPDGDGCSAVQLYARECSKLILQVLKSESRATVTGWSTSQNISALTPVKISENHEACFDISRGQRGFVEAEEAEKLLRPLKDPGNFYTKICFSNRSFGLDAAHIAGPILVSIKNQLKDVDLSDIVAGRAEAEALEVMNVFALALEGCNLRSLNLSNNALGEKGVRAFGPLLKSQSILEELYLMDDGISEEAALAVCELLSSTEKLRVLIFHSNMMGDEGAVAISEVVKHSPLLENFQCSSTRVASEGGVALSKALEICTRLKRLDLRDNIFGAEVVVSLSKALSKHVGLSEIYLSYLNLEDEGAISIATVLKLSAPSLEVLDMAGNEITAEAAPALAACIASKKLLIKLNLGENELKDEGAIQIAKVLEEDHKKLKEVDMNTNAIRRAGARRLAQAVVQKPEFKLLNIDGNCISDVGIDEVKGIFKKSPEMLGSFDENDPEGGDNDDEDNEETREDGESVENELGLKLKGLHVDQEM